MRIHYNAFISYRHHPDILAAKKLEKMDIHNILLVPELFRIREQM